MTRDKYELRLVIKKENQGSVFAASWIEPGGQQSEEFPLGLPLTLADMKDLRWYLEDYYRFPGAGDHERAEKIEARLKDWGRSLFDCLLGREEGKDVYHHLLEARKKERRCLITIASVDSDVLSQPWEMMRDKKGPLAFQGITLRRQLVGSVETQDHILELPLRILLIVSRPTDVSFIDPRNSIEPLLDALEALAGQVEIEFCEPPTLARLEQMISQAKKKDLPYSIVHFDGHGTYLPKTGIGALCFENDAAKNHLVQATLLGDLLAKLEIPLVMLEACRGADLSDRPVFGSLAPALLASGVGSVVAFSHSVHVQAAKLFVERFYRELIEQMTVGEAVEQARAGLRANPKRFLHRGPDAETIDLQDWFIAQLYQVGDDPSLQIRKSKVKKVMAPAPPCIEDRMPGFPPAPMYKFHGRALELLEIERAFRDHAAVLLSGMGGMGKTALAREAAHWWLRKARFERAAFMSFERKAGAERAVQVIGEAFEGPEFTKRPSEEQWEEAVKLFHRHKLLLVWDNFESTLPAFQYRGADTPVGQIAGDKSVPPTNLDDSPLSFGPDARALLLKLYRDLTDNDPHGRLLVTCRPDETGLPGIKEMELRGLQRPDSLYLLAAILDKKSIDVQRPGYERYEVDRLLDAIADHPLSIELIAPHLKTLKPKEIVTEFAQHLHKFENQSAFEDRNKSLLASLEFSKQRLSPQAQNILPHLAWFEGGAFEFDILAFTELSPDAWAPIRAELAATALINVEDLDGFKYPFIRFHPTLPYAANPSDVANPEESEKRFIGVYLAVMQIADKALHGHQPAAAMAHLTLEEANLRRAIIHSFNRGDRHEAWAMADTLRNYLVMASRLRERDLLVEWVRSKFGKEETLTSAACDAIRQHAWSRFTQGHAEEAIQTVEDLIRGLESEGLADRQDPTIQIGLSYLYLGRIYYHAGLHDLSLAPLRKAVSVFEGLGEKERGELALTLGDLANAYVHLGHFNEALEANERGLNIYLELGRDHDVAANLGRKARIFMAQERFSEADKLYEEAVRAAVKSGDLGLQGTTIQHQGSLQDDVGNYDRAVELYKEAIAIFKQANNKAAEMRTCNLLGTAELNRTNLEAAEAWYARTRELALDLNDWRQQAGVAHNLGILYQTKAEQVNDSIARAALFHQAVVSVKECLAIMLKMQNQVVAAKSFSQLAVLYRMLGELDLAEEHAKKSLEIRESLNLPDVYKDYNSLANIAHDRGDAEAEAKWRAKFEAKFEEVERLRSGGADSGPGHAPEELVKLILALAQAAYAARSSKSSFPPDAAEALAQMAAAPEPFPAIASFLLAVAGNATLPPVPSPLPPELAQILEALAKEVSKTE